jgi:hypothetical protein
MMRCNSLAEMPLRREEISNTAQNQTLNGFLVFSNRFMEVGDPTATTAVAQAMAQPDHGRLRMTALSLSRVPQRCLAIPASRRTLDWIGLG